MDSVKLTEVRLDPVWAFRVPPAIALRRLALPLCALDGRLLVAMADPSDGPALAAIRAATGLETVALQADRDELRAELLRVYGDVRAARPRAVDPADPVATVDMLLRAAALRRASDIHFNPERDGMGIRMRIDGRIEDFARLPAEAAPAVASRLKVMASLDIAEKRAPQDGAFVWTMPAARGAASAPMDVRVATLPVRYGERVTLRLLESGRDRLSLPTLGMAAADMATFRSVLANPHGLVLLTGPTGSGKTTTLYAAIRELLASAPLNVLTVEDPVEYEIAGVSQAEVDANDKVSFSRALRSLLRHDPDVIMIGEIRDAESLDTAVKAALTGHLVLSTLHTNDAAGVVTRLADMGLAPHMIAATLRLCAAQRLVRELCPACREPYAAAADEAALLGRPALAGRTVFRPRGCLACAGRGYVGRTGLFELLVPDGDALSMIAAGAGGGEVLQALRARGKMRTLADAAEAKLLDGATDASEIFRSLGGL